MDAVNFFEIIKKYNIIKDNSCERFELVGEDFNIDQLRVEWNNQSNQQEMKIYIGDNSYILINRKQGISVSEYVINKNFVALLKNAMIESEKIISYEDVIKHMKARSILEHLLKSSGIRDSEVIGMLDVFIDIIRTYERWASETYESRNICFCIGIDCGIVDRSGITLKSIEEDSALESMFKVVTNGIETMIVCNKLGQICGFEVMTEDVPNPYSSARLKHKFYPQIFSKIANWASGKKFAFVLTQLGEILIFRDKSLLFVKRRGEWLFLSPKSLAHRILKSQDTLKEIKEAVMDTCLDVSFSRSGACIGIIKAGDETPRCVLEESNLSTSMEPKVVALRKLIHGKNFHELDRRVRKELAAIDGAIVIDGAGKIHAIGAILDNSSSTSRSGSGGRTVAAQTLAKSGCGIKVSADGKIEAWQQNNTIAGGYESIFTLA